MCRESKDRFFFWEDGFDSHGDGFCLCVAFELHFAGDVLALSLSRSSGRQSLGGSVADMGRFSVEDVVDGCAHHFCVDGDSETVGVI